MIELTTSKKAVIIVVYTIICIAIGRYSAATLEKTTKETTKTEVKTETKDEKKDVKTKKDKKLKKVKIEKTNPDGSKETTITTTIDTSDKSVTKKDDKTTKTDDNKETSKETKVVERNSSKLNLGFLVGDDILNPTIGPSYGGYVNKEVLGPITIGAFGLSSGTCGLSLGLSL